MTIAPHKTALPDALDRITPAERRVIDGLLLGKINKEIASDLGTTEATVKVQVKSILKKVGARNRVQAVLWAVDNGLRETVG